MSAGGVKRPREREQADRRQEHRVEEVMTHTAHIVDAIAAINTRYVRTLNEEREGLVESVVELQTLHTSDQLRESETAMEVVEHSLQSLRGAVSSTVKERLIDGLRAQVGKGQGDVLAALTAHVDEALQGALTIADTQLMAERQLNTRLVEQLRSYAQTLLASAKAADERAFQAEVQSMQKDVAMAKLRATHLFDQNRLVRHEHEVDALMRLVTQLAEKSRFVESARTELQRAKRHVRWLEQHMDLKGIIAAAVPENTTAAAAEAAAASPSPALPNPALRQSAPHYYALKLLEHKDITLTELVDSWQAQEGRIAAAEQRYAELEEVVSQVQHDALVVHQRSLEEKQRRDIAERRITDMVRERLYPQKDASAFHEVQRLRWAYTEVVDDAAQLAVALKVCREELQAAQAETARCTAQVQQLQRDAETDQVALTIEEMRREYAERVRSLEEVSVRTQLQLTLAQQLQRQYGSVAEEATTTLREVSETNAELSSVPPHVVHAHTSGATLRSDWRQELQKVEVQTEKLAKLTADIKNYGLQHGELYEAQVTALMEQWSRVRSEATAKADRVRTAAAAAAAAASPTRSGPTAASPSLASGSLSASQTLVASSLSDESVTQLTSVTQSSKLALREALTLLVVSLQSIDVERSNLLEASLSDAQYVMELAKEVSSVTRERDQLRAQVKVCRDLLEKNHVTVVERALMHDVPAEDSLNVAEAAERITVLKDELTAARQLCDRALGEVRQVAAERESAEAQLAELSSTHAVLQGHVARLTERLQASQRRETALMAEAVSLQHQMVHLVQPTAATSSAGEGEVEDGTATPTAPGELTTLFTTLSEALLRLEDEVRSLHSARGETSSGVAGEMAAEEASATTAGQWCGESDDVELVSSLSRSGMMNIVEVLKDTLQKAGLLRASLRAAAGAQATALCTAAESAATAAAAAAAPTLPSPSLETQRLALEHRAAQQEARLAQYAAEQQQMRERLQRAEQTAGERETANQRLLAISKSVLEQQGVLKAENAQLRAQVQALMDAQAAAAQAAVEPVVLEGPVEPQPPPSTAAEEEAVPTAAEPTVANHVVEESQPEPTNVPPLPFTTAPSAEDAPQSTATTSLPRDEERAAETPQADLSEEKETVVAEAPAVASEDTAASAPDAMAPTAEEDEEAGEPPTQQQQQQEEE